MSSLGTHPATAQATDLTPNQDAPNAGLVKVLNSNLARAHEPELIARLKAAIERLCSGSGAS